MRKGSAIGLVFAVLFVSVIVGIASIPDEVLNETATAIENEAKIFSAPEKPESTAPKPAKLAEPVAPEIAEPSEPFAPVEPEPSEHIAPEPAAPATPEPTEPESSEPETQSEEPEGNVIRVEIRDGVGFGDK